MAETRPVAARLVRAGAIAGVSASAFASVPPEVKTTLRGSAPTSAATLARAPPRPQAPRRPALGMDRGRVAGDLKRRAMAARASGRSGAVAFQSR